MEKSEFEILLEKYLPDVNANNKVIEPDFKTLKCHFAEDSDFKKYHDKPSLQKIRDYCYPKHCLHLR